MSKTAIHMRSFFMRAVLEEREALHDAVHHAGDGSFVVCRNPRLDWVVCQLCRVDRVLDGVALAVMDCTIARGVVEIACASVAHGQLRKLNAIDRNLTALAGTTHGVGEASLHGYRIARCTHGEACIAEISFGLGGVPDHNLCQERATTLSVLPPFSAVSGGAA